MKGAQQWESLATALEGTKAACADDERFIRDREDMHADDLDHMRRICDGCPLFALCAAYANAAKPTGGFWAGDYGSRSYKRTTKETT
ncbi:WhiB family transcriptional regulator [Microbacterium sp. zg-YB36]|uniref:WhiB family transcriptional regulator n=1 Tax=Microbacterium sp. zg-YB36 TaxID=2969407 RepID=UPI00214C0FA6|nr:WhiB family transcriptional regulator [Microbacterium sp. zg-YB36]MDL5350558.1 WhiB family transcriptional regulator [Microbacterium sp. zg-YB36]